MVLERRKKKEKSTINKEKVFNATAKEPVLVTPDNDFFTKGDRSIINSISSVMIVVLRLLFIQYKCGQVTQEEINKTPTYLDNREFEELLVVLGKTKTLDGSKTYLQLTQELMCPPAGSSLDFKNDYSMIFKFAKRLAESNSPNYQEFETTIKQKIAEIPNRNYIPITPKKGTIVYKCPSGKISAQDLELFSKSLKMAITNAAMDAGISNWFRMYHELSFLALEYAKKIYNESSDLLKALSLKSNGKRAFSVMCGFALNAGIVAGKEYCEQKGNVEAAKNSILKMSRNQIADSAAKIVGFGSGDDQRFLTIMAPIPIAAADFLGNAMSNREYFMSFMLISLKTVFEFGTGLYFEY